MQTDNAVALCCAVKIAAHKLPAEMSAFSDERHEVLYTGTVNCTYLQEWLEWGW